MKLLSNFPLWGLVACTAIAQPASVQWLDSGGGTSTGDAWTLTGLIGGPDLATSTGGGYTLVGGMWGDLFSPRTSLPPTLRITRSSGNLVLSWAPTNASFVLQVSDSLTSGIWRDAPTGKVNPVEVAPTSTSTRFYRLRRESPAPAL